MALVALLFAHHTTVGATEPFAALHVAGMSAIERQARLVRDLGAERVVVFAERMPPGLAAALSQVGTDATTVRDAAQLSRSIDDGDRVLVVEEGLLPDLEAVEALVEAARPTALAVSVGEPPYPQAERLDAASFWAGIAVYGGSLVRAVAADLGEWDLQSTLLRSAIGESIPRVLLDDPAALQTVRDDRDAERVAARLIAATARPRWGWPSRYLYPMIERVALPALLTTRATGVLFTTMAFAAAVLAIPAFATGWLWSGLLLAIATEPLAGVGDRLAQLKLERSLREPLDRAVEAFIEPAWYAGLALALGARGAPGAWALAATAVAFRFAARRERGFYELFVGEPLDPSDGRERRLWTLAAAPETLLWLLVLFALMGSWTAGLVAIAASSAATFFLFQATVFRRLRARP